MSENTPFELTIANYENHKSLIAAKYKSLKGLFEKLGPKLDFHHGALLHLDELIYEYNVITSYIDVTKSELSQEDHIILAQINELVVKLEKSILSQELTYQAGDLPIIRQQLIDNAKEAGTILSLQEHSSPLSKHYIEFTLPIAKRSTYPLIQTWTRKHVKCVFDAIQNSKLSSMVSFEIARLFTTQLNTRIEPGFADYLLLHYGVRTPQGLTNIPEFNQQVDQIYMSLRESSLQTKVHEVRSLSHILTRVEAEMACKFRKLIVSCYNSLPEPESNYLGFFFTGQTVHEAKDKPIQPIYSSSTYCPTTSELSSNKSSDAFTNKTPLQNHLQSNIDRPNALNAVNIFPNLKENSGDLAPTKQLQKSSQPSSNSEVKPSIKQIPFLEKVQRLNSPKRFPQTSIPSTVMQSGIPTTGITKITHPLQVGYEEKHHLNSPPLSASISQDPSSKYGISSKDDISSGNFGKSFKVNQYSKSPAKTLSSLVLKGDSRSQSTTQSIPHIGTPPPSGHRKSPYNQPVPLSKVGVSPSEKEPVSTKVSIFQPQPVRGSLQPVPSTLMRTNHVPETILGLKLVQSLNHGTIQSGENHIYSKIPTQQSQPSRTPENSTQRSSPTTQPLYHINKSIVRSGSQTPPTLDKLVAPRSTTPSRTSSPIEGRRTSSTYDVLHAIDAYPLSRNTTPQKINGAPFWDPRTEEIFRKAIKAVPKVPNRYAIMAKFIRSITGTVITEAQIVQRMESTTNTPKGATVEAPIVINDLGEASEPEIDKNLPVNTDPRQSNLDTLVSKIIRSSVGSNDYYTSKFVNLKPSGYWTFELNKILMTTVEFLTIEHHDVTPNLISFGRSHVIDIIILRLYREQRMSVSKGLIRNRLNTMMDHEVFNEVACNMLNNYIAW